jgi:hypothetical protein
MARIFLVRNPEGDRSRGKPWRRKKKNMKLDHRKEHMIYANTIRRNTMFVMKPRNNN